MLFYQPQSCAFVAADYGLGDLRMLAFDIASATSRDVAALGSDESVTLGLIIEHIVQTDQPR